LGERFNRKERKERRESELIFVFPAFFAVNNILYCQRRRLLGKSGQYQEHQKKMKITTQAFGDVWVRFGGSAAKPAACEAIPTGLP
jgi:hypothetical protein